MDSFDHSTRSQAVGEHLKMTMKTVMSLLILLLLVVVLPYPVESLSTISKSCDGPVIWRRAEIDYSAANEYIRSHYHNNNKRIIRDKNDGSSFVHYFETSTKKDNNDDDDGKCVENIYNGRKGFWDDTINQLIEPSLQKCGFELQHAPVVCSNSSTNDSSMTDYKDIDQIKSIYLPFLRAEVLPKTFKDRKIYDIIFWFPMYREDVVFQEGQMMKMIQKQNVKENAYKKKNHRRRLQTDRIAPLVHIDSDIGAYDNIEQVAELVGNNRVDDQYQSESFNQQDLEKTLKMTSAGGGRRRFCIVNIWRNAILNEPIHRAPLALLSTKYDGSNLTCFPDSKPDFKTSRWYTFPNMTNDECPLFLQYDRDIQQPSDIWHCALTNVEYDDQEEEMIELSSSSTFSSGRSVDTTTSPRSSFDVRALVVFEEENIPPHRDRFADNRTRPRLTQQELESICDDQAKLEGTKVQAIVDKINQEGGASIV